jgi:hypothetical protein
MIPTTMNAIAIVKSTPIGGEKPSMAVCTRLAVEAVAGSGPGHIGPDQDDNSLGLGVAPDL